MRHPNRVRMRARLFVGLLKDGLDVEERLYPPMPVGQEEGLTPRLVIVRQAYLYGWYGLRDVQHLVHAEVDSAMQGDDAL